ncbi:MAG: HDOD domain-containing protein [Zoogloeaceae bacterium]|jgi:EAL and modified HD-GYP domain-containing signal transduction protein|nr:HDOD domain-containing protein [Zoogloeaceae bacterium]
MLGIFRNMFGSPKKPVPQDLADKAPETYLFRSDPDAASPNPAPDEDDSANDSADAFFCREAILGRDQRIIGYEFSRPQQMNAHLISRRAKVRQYYDKALLDQLIEMQLESIIGQRLAFLEISPLSLGYPALTSLPKDNVALTLTFPENTELAAETVQNAVQNAQALRAYGLQIGFKWQRPWLPNAASVAILQQIDFVHIVWPEYAGHSAILPDMYRIARQVNATESLQRPRLLRLIASHLNTPDNFRECYRLGFDFFCGSFINHQQEKKTAKNAANRLRIIQLLNNLRRDAHTFALEQELKQDPTLSYHLLRYANSPALGVRYEVTSIAQAITLLGRNYLYRWLTFLLLHVADPGYREWVLTEQALARAALMERLGKIKGDSALSPDSLFLTGLFSLLDQIMGYSLEELIAKIQIQDEIRVALVRREGILAQYLALAEACESTISENIEYRSRLLGFSASQVNLAVFNALAWAHEMSNITDANDAKGANDLP